MVLVDHGLYKQIDDDFRLTYARLWKGLMLADIPQIKESCLKLGVSQKMVCYVCCCRSNVYFLCLVNQIFGWYNHSNVVDIIFLCVWY